MTAPGGDARHLGAGEPAFGPWQVLPLAGLLARILGVAGAPAGRPRLVALDGRGAAGKTTLATGLRRLVPRSAVVHTDDLAWHEPLFGWGDLLADGVLRPLQDGQALAYRPPQWERRGRAGSIEVPAGLDLVLVEGTGASQREHTGLLDATVWVQADLVEAERRGIARDIAQGVNGDAVETVAFWQHWMAAELEFLARQRPWERACAVVHGTPLGTLPPGHVEVADVNDARVRNVGPGGPPVDP
ncbi:MAG: uridine kinase family protein [Nitriliruptoraceae bacterium]